MAQTPRRGAGTGGSASRSWSKLLMRICVHLLGQSFHAWHHLGKIALYPWQSWIIAPTSKIWALQAIWLFPGIPNRWVRIGWKGYDSGPWTFAEYRSGVISWDTRILEIRMFPSPRLHTYHRRPYPSESLAMSRVPVNSCRESLDLNAVA